MIIIAENLILRQITVDDHNVLLDLMKKIYPQTYQHLWEDGGDWYINKVYSFSNLEKELSEPNTPYYFVVFRSEIVGILRIQNDCPLEELSDQGASKLQRIYLDMNVQGKGLGRALIEWTAKQGKQFGSTLLWLEVMDTSNKAQQFYKKMGFQITGTSRIEMELLYPALRGMYKMWKALEMK